MPQNSQTTAAKISPNLVQRNYQLPETIENNGFHEVALLRFTQASKKDCRN
jgi:hypothetical protein